VLTELGQLALWLTPTVVVVSLIVAGALWALRHQRNCPSCKTAMRTVAFPGRDGGVPSYEVLVCETCTNAATLVHGHHARFAYCPSCLNRALRTPCMRQAGGSVRVHEHCELCGYDAEKEYGTAAPPAPPATGRVIPFPAHRARPPRRDDEAAP
jgi:hypothetical protein